MVVFIINTHVIMLLGSFIGILNMNIAMSFLIFMKILITIELFGRWFVVDWLTQTVDWPYATGAASTMIFLIYIVKTFIFYHSYLKEYPNSTVIQRYIKHFMSSKKIGVSGFKGSLWNIGMVVFLWVLYSAGVCGFYKLQYDFQTWFDAYYVTYAIVVGTFILPLGLYILLLYQRNQDKRYIKGITTAFYYFQFPLITIILINSYCFLVPLVFGGDEELPALISIGAYIVINGIAIVLGFLFISFNRNDKVIVQHPYSPLQQDPQYVQQPQFIQYSPQEVVQYPQVVQYTSGVPQLAMQAKMNKIFPPQKKN